MKSLTSFGNEKEIQKVIQREKLLEALRGNKLVDHFSWVSGQYSTESMLFVLTTFSGAGMGWCIHPCALWVLILTTMVSFWTRAEIRSAVGHL